MRSQLSTPHFIDIVQHPCYKYAVGCPCMRHRLFLRRVCSWNGHSLTELLLRLTRRRNMSRKTMTTTDTTMIFKNVNDVIIRQTERPDYERQFSQRFWLNTCVFTKLLSDVENWGIGLNWDSVWKIMPAFRTLKNVVFVFTMTGYSCKYRDCFYFLKKWKLSPNLKVVTRG